MKSPDNDDAVHDAPIRDASGREELSDELSVWVLIFGELLVFGCLFTLYAVDRYNFPDIFTDGIRNANRNLGAINTVLLLTSSCLIAMAVHFAEDRSKVNVTLALLHGAFACGVMFCILKCYDYYIKINDGFTINLNSFYSLYFMLTGIHFVHVLVGLVAISVMISIIGKPVVSRDARTIFNGCGLFWHLVDLLWVFLFALFYVAV